MGEGRRISTFEQEAARCLPGFLYSFNIADLKRRNGHLGHSVGDKDSEELDDLLMGLSADAVIIERIDAQRWFMLSRRNEVNSIQEILDHYTRTERFSAGWQVEATRHGVKKMGRQSVLTEISRAVRCLYTEVKSPSDVRAAMTEIEDTDYDLPVNWPHLLSTLPMLARKNWRCVAAYPEQGPACPFCQEQDFEWEGGDDSHYSGDGKCRTCGAEISIRDISEMARI